MGSEDGHILPPRPLVESIFAWLAPRYDRAVVTFSLGQDLRWKKNLLDQLAPRRDERALDLACGTGLLIERLKHRTSPRQVVGIDISSAMLHEAVANGHPGVLFRADAVRLPFRAQSFDVVSAGYLLKYVPLDLLAAEVYRVLRPGGRFGGYDFSAPLEGLVGTGYSFYLHTVLEHFPLAGGIEDHAYRQLFEFLGRMTRESGWEARVVEALEAAGFREVRLTPSLGGAITRVVATKF